LDNDDAMTIRTTGGPILSGDQADEFFVFGYGSLMWNPGFVHVDARPGLVSGCHRRFCIYSHRYRGSPARPGLVLGLDRGGSCRGVLFRLTRDQMTEALPYLEKREMISAVYKPRVVRVRHAEGQTEALCFVADRTHPQYAGMLDDEQCARIIAHSSGERGSNPDYLENTLQHLRDLGIVDRDLVRLSKRVRALIACGDQVRPLPDYIEDWSI
jgi:cation transport protein ChaC